MAFGFYSDAALTTQLQTGTPLAVSQNLTTGADPVDSIIYFGSPTTAGTVEAVDAADPGVNDITLSVADAASGSGQPATAVRLALSAGGLDTATPGAALAIGASVLSGAVNAVAIHVRIDDQTDTVGVYTDLSLTCSEITEQPV